MIKKITPELIKLAKAKFSSKTALSDKQLVARYLISETLEKKYGIKNFFPEKNRFQYFSEDVFWSISYKGDFIATIVSDKKVGIDLELLENKNVNLFNFFSEKEWRNIGNKNWENFYIIWTGKEAIIKKISGTLDDLKKIDFKQKKSQKSFFNYDGEDIEIQFFIKQNYIYSITT